MRLRAAEKAEVIRLVEGSELSVRRTLAELGVQRSTFYAWYRRYVVAGETGLATKKPAAQRYWNRIPPAVRKRVVTAALADPERSPRELAGSSPIGRGISSRNPASIASSRPRI